MNGMDQYVVTHEEWEMVSEMTAFLKVIVWYLPYNYCLHRTF